MPFTKEEIVALRGRIAKRLSELVAEDGTPTVTEIPENPKSLRVGMSNDEDYKKWRERFGGLTTAGACKVQWGEWIICLADIQSRTSGMYDAVGWMHWEASHWVEGFGESWYDEQDFVHDTISMDCWRSTSVEEFEDQWEVFLSQADEDEQDEDELPELETEEYGHDA